MNEISSDYSQMNRWEMRATFLVALSATLYGCLGFLGIKLLNEHLSVPAMLFWRFLIATVWMCGVGVTKLTKARALKDLNKRSVIIALMLGALYYSGGSAFYFLASERIGTGLAMVIFFAYPMFIVLYRWLVERHAITIYTILSLLAIFIGIILLRGYHVSAAPKVGIMLGIVAALFYATYVCSSKSMIKTLPPYMLTMLVCLGSTLVFFIIAVVNHKFSYPTSISGWFYVVAIGVIATALPIQLMLAGLKFIDSHKAAILSVLEPAVTFLVGITALAEPVSTLQIIGVLVILSSVICIQFEK